MGSVSGPVCLVIPGMWDSPARYGPLLRRIEATGRTAVSMALHPSSGVPTLERLVPQVRAQLGLLRDIWGSQARPIEVVGFSMGALVALAAIEDCPGWVRTLVSVGTPHAGTWAALLWPTPCGRDFLPRSAFSRRHTRVPKGTRIGSVASRRDRIIWPWHSALHPQAEVTRVVEHGFHPKLPRLVVVQDAVIEILDLLG